MKEKVLVIAAHPDDEVLGCGGTMARLIKEEIEVYVAILGEGETSRFTSPTLADPERIRKLKSNSQKAAELLGVREVFQFDLPDNRFDTVPLLNIVKIVEDLIMKTRPHTIFTHHGSDLNVDHQMTNRAVLTATRPVNGMGVKRVYAFEVPSSTEWAFQTIQPQFHANFFVDISNYIDAKLKAMAQYESEMRPFPHPRSNEALRAIATRWGSVVGCQGAEAFELVREIR